MDSVSQQSDDCVEIGGSLVWPAVIENFLLDTMLEEMKKGHLVSATFSKTGWQRIINALKDKFNKLYTQKQLVNKYGVMKTRYSNFKNLLSHTGMGYNEITGQLTADEEVWRLAKATNKGAGQFKKKGCPEYPKLCALFGDTSATGAFAKSSRHPRNDDGDQYIEIDGTGEDETDVEEVSKPDEGKLKSKYSKKPKVADDGPNKHMMDGMVEQRKRTNDLLERKLDMASAASKHHRSQSLLDCMILLQDMEIEDVQFTKALGILEATVNFRQCFIRMNDDRRMGWVRNLDYAKSD
ncbi:L10-interacting MYB domain-containing protein [Linum perenne]